MYGNEEFEAKKIEIVERQLADQQAHDKSASLLLKLGFVLTFLLYLMFNQHLYIGDATTLSEYFKTPETLAGFSFLLVVVVLMALFLAWVKHHAYLHFGFFGQVGTVVAVVIGFALFAEFFSASANQDAKSTIALKGNEAYQATIQATTGGNASIGAGGFAGRIAKAEQRLASCQKKVASGAWKDCDESEANLKSLIKSEARALKAAQEASTAQLETNYARQDKLKADSYNPVIVSFAKALAGQFGGNYEDWIKTAVVLAMLIVAICFEFLHHWLSKSKEASYNAVQALELELAKLRGGFNPMFNSEENDSRPAPQGEKQPMGFGTPATAQFKYQQRQEPESKPMGFTPWTNEQPTPKKKDSKSTWNKELSKSGIDSPDDPAMNRQADQAQIDRILAAGQRPLDGSSQLGIPSESSDKSSGLASELQAVSDQLYPAWRKAVKAKELTHAKAKTQNFIWERTGTESETLTAPETARIWKVWQKKGLADGLLKNNPDYKAGNRKPKFILA